MTPLYLAILPLFENHFENGKHNEAVYTRIISRMIEKGANWNELGDW